MSVIGKIFGFLGFESTEKESKQKNKKEKKVKASYNLKKKQKVERIDSIDGVKIVYPEDIDDSQKILKFFKNDEAVIISIEYYDKDEVEKLVAYLTGASQMISGKIRVLEKEKYYIFLPEGVDIEEWVLCKI